MKLTPQPNYPRARPRGVSDIVLIAVRVSPDFRRRVRVAALEAGIPLSAWVTTAIKERMRGER